MKKRNRIENVFAHEIIDSRGNPTVEAFVGTFSGECASASAPSGASTGSYEAHELRDGDRERYGGKGVLCAVENVNGAIASSLRGRSLNQAAIDRTLIRLDGTENKTSLGANATLAVSLAAAKAAALCQSQPLYRYLGGTEAVRLPIPMMNILNGGAHASNNLDIQEFMIMPTGFDSFSAALRAGCEIYHTLAQLLRADGKSTGVGDEGGFAPDLRDEREALRYITDAVEKAGYSGRVEIALDVAASEWQKGNGYVLPKSGESLTSDEAIGRIEKLCGEFPITSVEDALGEDDSEGWIRLTERLGKKIALVGDDLFVTNPKRLLQGIRNGIANAVLVKPNQIGTLTETMEVIRIAHENSYRTVIYQNRSAVPRRTHCKIQPPAYDRKRARKKCGVRIRLLKSEEKFFGAVCLTARRAVLMRDIQKNSHMLLQNGGRCGILNIIKQAAK